MIPAVGMAHLDSQIGKVTDVAVKTLPDVQPSRLDPPLNLGYSLAKQGSSDQYTECPQLHGKEYFFHMQHIGA